MNNSESPSTQCEVSTSEYTRRLERRQRQLADIRVLHQRLLTYLIVVVLAGIVIAYATLSWHLISPLWILLPSAGLLSITQSLTKNARIHTRVQRIASFYELGARLRHQWQGRVLTVMIFGLTTIRTLPTWTYLVQDLFSNYCVRRGLELVATLARWLL
jgi:hypothetical protein